MTQEDLDRIERVSPKDVAAVTRYNRAMLELIDLILNKLLK